MNKVAVVFWSGTGNTEAMARAVADGVNGAGGEAVLLQPADFNSSVMKDYGAVAFGCPSMGDEVLEEYEYEPMFADLENDLGGKKIALFGSYGWGDGQWMRDWDDRVKDHNANVVCDYVMANETPNDADVENCKKLGAALATA